MKTFSVVALFGFALLGFLGGCGRTSAPSKPADVDYYTCMMHPSVKSQDPTAKCPICSMDLVPVKKQPAVVSGHDEHRHGAEAKPTANSSADTTMPSTPADEKPREFTIPLDRQQLIGVTYATVEKTPLKSVVRAAGTVAANRLRHWDYVSRVEGYVQKLEVASRGEPVKAGQALLTLYSPDLLATQREYVEALRIRDKANTSGSDETLVSAEQLVNAARRRLSLWNLGKDQLDQLEKSRLPADTLTLTSPFDGVVLDLATNQGSRVMPGDHLVDVADLSVLWVWAEFYQDELPLVRPGIRVSITSSAFPNETLSGQVALVDPFLNETKRTGRVRIDVENREMKLRPEMYVNVEADLDLGVALSVPVGAILPTGERNIVFVDKGGGKLEPRFIEIGRKAGDRVVVAKGLAEGERVVSSANFLIDAEAKVQGVLKSW